MLQIRIATLATVVTALLTGASSAHSAQLADLQPGRNFPAAVDAFGGSRAENIDVGDVDNDGDYDVGVAAGGDGTAQDNLLFINLGGAQGGQLATFGDESATRFAGVPTDRSRDLEFVDFEGDGDLDVFITNHGTSVMGGDVSRAYLNHGGEQRGAVGFYSEWTDDFWGQLVNVPSTQEVGAPFGEGPFREYSCDCDFADFNDDGQLDLFFSSYGPNINGSLDSRIFLNDGQGHFDELWPWVDAAADIRLHTLDVDLADLDGDYAIDIIGSSRDSQSRVYRNNLFSDPPVATLFTDLTQSALLDTGAGLSGSNTYETEYADVDGDGDFDLGMLNYDGSGGGNLDRILRNNGDFTFTKMSGWIVGDPNVDENEFDFLDYDSDGDLDLWVANFTGTNFLYASGVAQDISPALGLLHRTGSSPQAPDPELPPAGNFGQSLDGECADMDNDGDPDLLLANDLNQTNRYYSNALGVPDTFAPTFHSFTQQADKTDGSDTVIHAAVRDNAPHYIVAYYRASLIYTLDGGQERCVRMAPQSSQQFRAVIPGEHDGQIAYRVEVTDDAGNQGVSTTVTYTQSGGAPGGWQSLSCGTAGVNGVPYLEGTGTLAPGTLTKFRLRHAAAEAPSMLFLSLQSMPMPFKQGVFYPFPIDLMLPCFTDAGGLDHLQLSWPELSLLPSGSTLFAQYVVQDLAHSSGVSLSNGLLATVP